jgi:hypothetical protein
MKLIGTFARSTRSNVISSWIGLAVIGIFLLPWIAIAIGCILIGIGAVIRGEHALTVCLPTGLAVLLLPSLLFYLDRRWYRRISQFVLDGSILTYKFARDSVETSQKIQDVRWVEHRTRRGHTHGYLVKFKDGSGIFVCRSLSSADELAKLLKNVTKDRSTMSG